MLASFGIDFYFNKQIQVYKSFVTLQVQVEFDPTLLKPHSLLIIYKLHVHAGLGRMLSNVYLLIISPLPSPLQ